MILSVFDWIGYNITLFEALITQLKLFDSIWSKMIRF